MRNVFFIFILGFLIFLLFLGFANSLFNQFIFNPYPQWIMKPSVPFEDLNINGVSAWLFYKFPKREIVLFCHGNNANISYRLYMMEFCQKAKLNLMLFDYPGFGHSSGPLSISGTFESGRTIYQYLRERYHKKQIILWGESLGGSIAIDIAAKYKVHSMILQSTFSDLKGVVTNITGFWGNFLNNFLYPLTYYPLSEKIIENTRCPTAIIHSVNDELIPYEQGVTLYENCGSKKKILLTIDGKHARPEMKEETIEKLLRFIGVFHDDIDLKALSRIYSFSN